MVSHWLSVRLSVSLLYFRLSVFSVPDNNLSKCQWIFTKLGMCIGIVEVWFRIANGQILSIFDYQFLIELSAHNMSVFSLPDDHLSK